MKRWPFPAPRARAAALFSTAPEAFGRVEPSALATQADAAALHHTFSGAPDVLELAAFDHDASFSLRTRDDRQRYTVIVEAATRVAVPGLGVEVVFAANATAGSNARVQVVGKWASRPAPAPAPAGAAGEAAAVIP